MKKFFKALILFLTIFITSCGSLPHFELDPSLDYPSFKDCYLESINDFYLQKEEVYGIYLYRVDCDACNENKNVVLNHLNEYKKGNKNFKIYIYNTVRLKEEGAVYDDRVLSVDETRNEMLSKKVSTLKDTIINVVPSLYIINQGVLNDFIAGGIEPAKYLLETTLDSRSYKDIPGALLDNLDNFYLQDYKKYYVYIYFETCPYCLKIKGEIISYLLSEKNKEVPIFVFDMKSSLSEEGKENRAKFKLAEEATSSKDFKRFIEENIKNKETELKNTYYRYVPALYEISDNHYSNCYIGETEVVSQLKR